MRRTTAAMCLFAATGASWGGELDRLQNLSQSEFLLISEDLGAAASSKVYPRRRPWV